jgi:hypothetical protein
VLDERPELDARPIVPPTSAPAVCAPAFDTVAA